MRVQRYNRCLFWESCGTHKYKLWEKWGVLPLPDIHTVTAVIWSVKGQWLVCCHVSGAPWVITGSGLGDWIYWHLPIQSIITAHNQWLSKTRSIPSWTTSVFYCDWLCSDLRIGHFFYERRITYEGMTTAFWLNCLLLCTAACIVSGNHGKYWLLVRIRGKFCWFRWHGKRGLYQVGLWIRISIETCVYFVATSWFLQRYSLLRIRVLTNRCLAIDDMSC
jgi:hypothetical protein